ncbi:MAG: pantoate--beta-alanine ligase [Flavobacteriaceae bacterium]
MPIIQSLHELEEFKKARGKHRPWGLVPTMGALHQGHLSLIEKADQENALAWVSIFVNPTQFNDPKDLQKYPQTLASDIRAIQEIAPETCVFVPSVDMMYPNGLKLESFDLMGLDQPMEGQYRSNHFDGVATVVQRLFELVAPERAYFGEKDYQQLKIVELIGNKMQVDICPCPIVREANGLAMSSRNQRLTTAQKEQAAALFDVLNQVKTAFGKAPIEELHNIVEQTLGPLPDINLEYFEIADSQSLKKIEDYSVSAQSRAFISVWIGGVRLIDNMLLI